MPSKMHILPAGGEYSTSADVASAMPIPRTRPTAIAASAAAAAPLPSVPRISTGIVVEPAVTSNVMPVGLVPLNLISDWEDCTSAPGPNPNVVTGALDTPRMSNTARSSAFRIA